MWLLQLNVKMSYELPGNYGKKVNTVIFLYFSLPAEEKHTRSSFWNLRWIFMKDTLIATLDMLLAFSLFSFLLNRAAWCIFCVYVIVCPDPSPGNETLARPHQLPEWWWLQESSWRNPPRNVWLSMARLPLSRQPGPSDLVSAELQKPPCLKSRELWSITFRFHTSL